TSLEEHMTSATFLSALSACFGLVAAVFFAWGVASLSDKDIRDLSTPRRDENRVTSETLIKQRAEYAVGAASFFVSFCWQLASLASPSMSTSAMFQDAYAGWIVLLIATATWFALAVSLRAKIIRMSRNLLSAAQETK